MPAKAVSERFLESVMLLKSARKCSLVSSSKEAPLLYIHAAPWHNVYVNCMHVMDSGCDRPEERRKRILMDLIDWGRQRVGSPIDISPFGSVLRVHPAGEYLW